MQMISAVSLAVFALLWHGAQAEVDCSDVDSLYQEQMKCFERYDVHVSGGDWDQNFMTHMANSATVFCRQGVENYRPAMECALDVSRSCLRELSVNTDLVPSADRILEGITYICQHSSEMNPTCMENHQSAVLQCARSKVLQFGRSSLRDAVELFCAGMNLAYQCMAEKQFPCGERNLEILLTYMNDYVRPPACTSRFTSGVTARKSPAVFKTPIF